MGPEVNLTCLDARDKGVSCPPATAALSLMAAQLRSATDDAGDDVNCLVALLHEILEASDPVGSGRETVENAAEQMLAHMQFFDLLVQRIDHIASALDAVAQADGLNGEHLPSFDILVALLRREYRSEAEYRTHRHFFQDNIAGCHLGKLHAEGNGRSVMD